MKKKYIGILIVVIILVLVITAIIIPQKNGEVEENLLNINYDVSGNESKLDYSTENPVVAMYIQNYGSVVIELYPEVAPNTVNNFISLIKDGFYDNNTMHRLVPGFVLQGGDPKGTGSGGPNYSINGEFSSNGFENNLTHEKWVISMARSEDPNSAGSQFFICLDDAKFLDGNYAAFGKVIDGFNNIENIEKNEIVENSDTGKLKNNLKIKKVLIDLKNKNYPAVEKMN